MPIEKNLKARLQAELIGSLADDEAKVHGRRFWRELAKIVMAHVPAPTKVIRQRVVPMEDKRAKLFGSQKMPFGQDVGSRVDDVPMELLQWYADQTFTDDLRRYLASDRVKSENR